MPSALGSAVAVAGLVAVAVVHTVVAAVATRFFRLRLATWWGPLVYAVLVVPVVYVATTLVLLGGLGLAGGLELDRTTLVLVLWAVPLSLGVSLDAFWMPAPEDVGLPESPEDHQ